MSKTECNALHDRALENGWPEPAVSAAYFDARLGMPDELVHMAETEPEAEQDA